MTNTNDIELSTIQSRIARSNTRNNVPSHVTSKQMYDQTRIDRTRNIHDPLELHKQTQKDTIRRHLFTQETHQFAG